MTYGFIAYDLLKDFCQVKEQSNSFLPRQDPKQSNRVKFITDFLEKEDIRYNLDIFNYTRRFKKDKQGKDWHKIRGKYVNIEIPFFFDKHPDIKPKETVILIAHHDIHNIDSENCNDNSASVCNLLDICKKIKDNKNIAQASKNNICVVLTDAEEFGHLGAINLAKKIKQGKYGKVKYVINFELTAFGNKYWIDVKEGLAHKKFKNFLEQQKNKLLYSVRTPANDSVDIRKYNIDSPCIGILPHACLYQAVGNGDCATWKLCHSKEDEFKQANKEDMKNFVNTIFEFVTKI